MMTCKDAEKLIPEFLDDDLDNRELSEFLAHVDSCPECKEELTIQFLVRVGMQRLEDGNTFNLSRELDHLLVDSKKRLSARRYLVMTSYILEIAVAALLATCLLLAIAL
ncbi:anti-sigma factor family protein [Butyrivibrio sp. AE2032]|uniref:anti-sigma factor family protein n=1 Tax=Butyrivibrio sp. AE2032 TaxID=1458463 RepID=UPI0009DDA704|nr:zf-HC2 domain-containing protein [Butyrivibrio sp. AE2032]